MSRELNPAQIWSQAPLANRTSSTVRSQQIVSGTIAVADLFVGTKDVTLTAVTDITKCIPMAGLIYNTYLAFTTIGGGGCRVDVTPVIFNTTTLRFTVAANSGAGASTIQYSVRVVEYY